MPVRGIRGAITVKQDEAEAILAAARELLLVIQQANPALHPQDIASILFTATPDLAAAFPAKAARQLGWDLVPVVDAQELPVPGSLPLCIRVLLHWNTDLPQSEIKHIYLGEAASLRPDLTRNQ
jgi:chorismate mutase